MFGTWSFGENFEFFQKWKRLWFRRVLNKQFFTAEKQDVKVVTLTKKYEEKIFLGDKKIRKIKKLLLKLFFINVKRRKYWKNPK